VKMFPRAGTRYWLGRGE